MAYYVIERLDPGQTHPINERCTTCGIDRFSEVREGGRLSRPGLQARCLAGHVNKFAPSRGAKYQWQLVDNK